jgi:hypothetical protein
MLANALSSPACEYAAVIALLAFALKRLWAIDLELRAHREEQRARLDAARKGARLARELPDRQGATTRVGGDGDDR